jgi:hypothetical protein
MRAPHCSVVAHALQRAASTIMSTPGRVVRPLRRLAAPTEMIDPFHFIHHYDTIRSPASLPGLAESEGNAYFASFVTISRKRAD